MLKTDPVAEGVHFLADDAPEDVAWKALAVNVSDLAAKAARPLGYLMALSFPEAPAPAWLARFAAGLTQAQARFGCHLIGGDTDRRPGPLTITITVIGEVRAGPHGPPRHGAGRRCPVRLRHARRRRARPRAAQGARARLGLGPVRRPKPSTCCAATRGPSRALRSATALRRHASAAMDISDGLAKDLGRMCAASGCAARVRLADLPLSPAAAKALAADPASPGTSSPAATTTRCWPPCHLHRPPRSPPPRSLPA